jgi:hypothetical protein
VESHPQTRRTWYHMQSEEVTSHLHLVCHKLGGKPWLKSSKTDFQNVLSKSKPEVQDGEDKIKL